MQRRSFWTDLGYLAGSQSFGYLFGGPYDKGCTYYLGGLCWGLLFWETRTSFLDGRFSGPVPLESGHAVLAANELAENIFAR